MSRFDSPERPDEPRESRETLKRYLLDSLADLGYDGPTELHPLFLLPEKPSDINYAVRSGDDSIKRKRLMIALKFTANASGTTERAMYEFLKDAWQTDTASEENSAISTVKPYDPDAPYNNPKIDSKLQQLNERDRE